MEFLVGFDAEPQILQSDNQLSILPPGRRAHEMPDIILKWIGNLYRIKNNICSFFDAELWNAIDVLQDNDFEDFFNGLVSDINKAVDSLEHWMGMWLHLPLSVCQLGGKYGHEFARSYLYVRLKIPKQNS